MFMGMWRHSKLRGGSKDPEWIHSPRHGWEDDSDICPRSNRQGLEICILGPRLLIANNWREQEKDFSACKDGKVLQLQEKKYFNVYFHMGFKILPPPVHFIMGWYCLGCFRTKRDSDTSEEFLSKFPRRRFTLSALYGRPRPRQFERNDEQASRIKQRLFSGFTFETKKKLRSSEESLICIRAY